MYKVKFYKRDYFYFYLYRDNVFITKFLGFCELVNYIEDNNIDFKKVKFNLSLSDLFYHIVDYNSIHRLTRFNKFQEQKRKDLKL